MYFYFFFKWFFMIYNYFFLYIHCHLRDAPALYIPLSCYILLVPGFFHKKWRSVKKRTSTFLEIEISSFQKGKTYIKTVFGRIAMDSINQMYSMSPVATINWKIIDCPTDKSVFVCSVIEHKCLQWDWWCPMDSNIFEDK